MDIVVRSDHAEIFSYTHGDIFTLIARGNIANYPGCTMQSHWHDDVEFIYVPSGRMLYNVNGTVVELNGGEGVFVNARQIHFGCSDTKTACQYLCLLLDPVRLCSSPYLETTFVRPFLETGPPFVKLSSAVPWQKTICDSIAELYACREADTFPLSLHSLFFGMWRLLMENNALQSDPATRIHADLASLKEMILFIQSHYAERITLEEIAKAGSVCKSTCGQLFRRHLHKTPFDYLIDYRLDAAARLLRSTGRPVSEIAAETGFFGLSYFAQTFRKVYGCTPIAYRKQEKS